MDRAIWTGALELPSFALPIAFALIASGTAGAFGVFDIVPSLLLLVAALGLQLVSNIARIYGDRLDRERARRDYYERKFAEFKRFDKRYDPLAGTAGDLVTMRLRGMLALSVALTAAFAYAFALSRLGEAQMALALTSLAGTAVAIAFVLLRYLGELRIGYRPWGAGALFIVMTACCLGAEWLLVGRFVMPLVFPAAAFGALACAAANLGDIARMEDDADLAQTDFARRTIPLATSINGAFMLQAAAIILAMLWLAVFPFSTGAASLWSYAFALFFIPMALDLASLRHARPADVARLRLTLAISTLLAAGAFFFCTAGVNLVG